MFKFRNLILPVTAAAIAVGGVTAVSTVSADAKGWKEKRHERSVYRERRGVTGWLRDRRASRDGVFSGKRHKKHWKKRRHNRRGGYAEPAPRYRPMK